MPVLKKEARSLNWIIRNRWALLVAAFALLAPTTVALNALSETFTATNIIGTSTVTSPSHVVSGGTSPSIEVCNASPPTATKPAGSLCLDTSTVKVYQTTGGGSWAQVGGFTAYGPAGVYGTGEDGTVTFDGVSSVLGIAPVSNQYLLTRDVFFDTVTINAGVTVHTGNYRFYVKNTLTLNGKISDDGEGGQTPTGIFGGNPGVGCCPGHYGSAICPANGGQGALPFGAPGGNGGNQSGGTGAAAGASSAAPRGFAGTHGGTGSTGTGVGGAGGNSNEAAWAQDGDARAYPWAATGRRPFALTNTSTAGSGGGGGGGGGASEGGGGGGAGGCWLVVLAKHWTGTGSVSSRGGDGGNGEGVAGAGGGGGQGGVIAFITSDTTIPTTNVTAGTVGTGGTPSTSASNGLVINLAGT